MTPSPPRLWPYVLAAQQQPFLYIVSNGSKWAGEDPDGVDDLVRVLREHPLDPRLELYGGFITIDPCRAVRGGHNGRQWVDGPRLFDVPVTCFSGNFFTVSHVFDLYTNVPGIITELTQAIRTNQASESYQNAKKTIDTARASR